MPKFFSYEVSTIEIGHTRYYAHFKVLEPLSGNVVYDWDFEDISPNQAGISIVKEYTPGEYLISLYKIVNNAPSEFIEATIVFIIAIPQSKLADGQLQPINTVDLFTTVSLKQSITLPTKMLELGDSYAQNKSDYINEFDETWDITTGLLTKRQKNRVEATFQQLGGVSPLNFIPSVGEAAVSVVCESWKPTQLSNSDYQLSIQAKRFFSRPRISFIDPPFRGGQCVGVLYFVVVDAVQERGVTAGGLSFSNIPGPIYSIEALSTPFQGGTEGDVKITYANTSQIRRFSNCNIGASPVYCGFTELRNIQITRMDGLPDNCGDLPVV